MRTPSNSTSHRVAANKDKAIRNLKAAVRADGFRLVHTEGDHMVFTKRANNLRTAGMSRERYFELLGR